MTAWADWQYRVKGERDALNVKVKALDTFLDAQATAGEPVLNNYDLGLLMAQRDAMTNYLNILERRIERFGPDTGGVYNPNDPPAKDQPI
jgi:hypothetical protein